MNESTDANNLKIFSPSSQTSASRLKPIAVLRDHAKHDSASPTEEAHVSDASKNEHNDDDDSAEEAVVVVAAASKKKGDDDTVDDDEATVDETEGTLDRDQEANSSSPQASPPAKRRGVAARKKSPKQPKASTDSHTSKKRPNSSARPPAKRRRAAAQRQLDSDDDNDHDGDDNDSSGASASRAPTGRTDSAQGFDAVHIKMLMTGADDKMRRQYCKFEYAGIDIYNLFTASKAAYMRIRMHEDFHKDSTHLVMFDEELRSVKLLTAICRRMWVVSSKWLDDADTVKRRLPSCEPYENTYFPGARRARVGEKSPLDGVCILLNGTDFALDLNVLKRLIQLAGGRVVSSKKKADVVVSSPSGSYVMPGAATKSARDAVPIVAEKWLLDTISDWQTASYESYYKYQQ